MNVIKLPSGNELALGFVPLEEAAAAVRLLSKELKQVDINLGPSISGMLKRPLNDLKNALAQLLGSEEVWKMAGTIAQRCNYNGKPIKKDTFDDMKAREDMLPVYVEVLKHAIVPFFKGFGSESSPNPSTPESTPKA